MGSHRHAVILTNDIDISVGGTRDNVDPWVANEKTRQDVAYRELRRGHGGREAATVNYLLDRG
jgi:hypothetical protein